VLLLLLQAGQASQPVSQYTDSSVQRPIPAVFHQTAIAVASFQRPRVSIIANSHRPTLLNPTVSVGV